MFLINYCKITTKEAYEIVERSTNTVINVGSISYTIIILNINVNTCVHCFKLLYIIFTNKNNKFNNNKMKLTIIVISFICLFILSFQVKIINPSVLSNKEIETVMKSLGNLNLEEACVICRYVTEKINRIVDLSNTCPDNLRISFPFVRSRTWFPDNKVISKWNSLFHEQNNLNNEEKLVELSIFQKSIGDTEPIKPIGQSSFEASNEDINVITPQRNNAIINKIVPVERISLYPGNKEGSQYDNRIIEDNSNILENKARRFFGFQDMSDNNKKKTITFSSFIEEDSSSYIKRKMKRSRFPDVQFECAKSHISKITNYLCREELSLSYQKYCKPILAQLNNMIESFLYHDNDIEICQNLHMCLA